jgi:transglutaminase-like putative cysteine protease
MILSIDHELAYSYTGPVSLNPHYLYLTAKPSPYQQILESKLIIEPKPSVIVKNIDQEGNVQHVCFFNEKLDMFKVSAHLKIQTDEFSPLDFILYPFETAKLPFNYNGKLGVYAQYFLHKKNIDQSIKDYAYALAKSVDYKTLDFLLALVAKINNEFKYQVRELGQSHNSVETLNTKTGSCRDFSVFMMDICSVLGIVSRFVSGYLFGTERHEHELHAWVEVLLPGAGWRGFDPTEGRVVNKKYIALASSVEPHGLNPVRGTFRAENNVKSILKTKVQISEAIK